MLEAGQRLVWSERWLSCSQLGSGLMIEKRVVMYRLHKLHGAHSWKDRIGHHSSCIKGRFTINMSNITRSVNQRGQKCLLQFSIYNKQKVSWKDRWQNSFQVAAIMSLRLCVCCHTIRRPNSTIVDFERKMFRYQST